MKKCTVVDYPSVSGLYEVVKISSAFTNSSHTKLEEDVVLKERCGRRM